MGRQLAETIYCGGVPQSLPRMGSAVIYVMMMMTMLT